MLLCCLIQTSLQTRKVQVFSVFTQAGETVDLVLTNSCQNRGKVFYMPFIVFLFIHQRARKRKQFKEIVIIQT